MLVSTWTLSRWSLGANWNVFNILFYCVLFSFDLLLIFVLKKEWQHTFNQSIFSETTAQCSFFFFLAKRRMLHNNNKTKKKNTKNIVSMQQVFCVRSLFSVILSGCLLLFAIFMVLIAKKKKLDKSFKGENDNWRFIHFCSFLYLAVDKRMIRIFNLRIILYEIHKY